METRKVVKSYKKSDGAIRLIAHCEPGDLAIINLTPNNTKTVADIVVVYPYTEKGGETTLERLKFSLATQVELSEFLHHTQIF